MTRIRVDTDILLQNADAINVRAISLRENKETLLQKILSTQSEYAGLASEARQDGFAARETIQSVQGPLEGRAESLAALARAFRSVDEETVSLLMALRGEGWLRQTFSSVCGPDVDGFQPYDSLRTRMLLADWVPVYVQGPNGLSQMDTYHAGHILNPVVGTWKDPRTGKEYFVVDMGGVQFAYIPQNKASAEFNLSRITTRSGVFFDGMKITDTEMCVPFGGDKLQPDWSLPGDPWQNLILGLMHITSIGNASFPLVPHHNLCGELSVLMAVGETDPEAGLSRFAELRGLGYWNSDGTKTEYTGTQVLRNVHHTTSSHDLKRLFEEYGWESRVSDGAMPTPEELAVKLQSGSKFVFLTELDTRKEIPSPETGRSIPNPTYAQLVPGAPPQTAGRAAHWVMLMDVLQDGNGAVFVEAFNPFTGGQETYSWDTFVKTLEQAGNQLGKFTFVEAEKKNCTD
jgi:hypothetical protein